jgi:hypothetical protein
VISFDDHDTEAERDRLTARVAELERERGALRAAAAWAIAVAAPHPSVPGPADPLADPLAALTSIYRVLSTAIAPAKEGGAT